MTRAVTSGCLQNRLPKFNTVRAVKIAVVVVRFETLCSGHDGFYKPHHGSDLFLGESSLFVSNLFSPDHRRQLLYPSQFSFHNNRADRYALHPCRIHCLPLYTSLDNTIHSSCRLYFVFFSATTTTKMLPPFLGPIDMISSTYPSLPQSVLSSVLATSLISTSEHRLASSTD